MRTTVEISDALYDDARAIMAKRRTTLRNLIEEGLRRVLRDEQSARREFSLRDASAGEGGLVEGASLDWSYLGSVLYPDGSV